MTTALAPTSTKPPRIHPTSMIERPGWMLRAIIGWVFGRVELPAERVAKLRELAATNTLVYVGRNTSVLEYLYLSFVCLEYGLPPARFANGMWLFAIISLFLRPLGRFFPTLGALLSRADDKTAFERALTRGESVALYLRRPITVVDGAPRGFEGPYFERLTTITPPKPIVIVPLVFLWGSPALRQSRRTLSLTDRLLGDSEAPGTLRMLWNFFSNYGHAQVLLGEPLAVAEWLASETDSVSPENRALRLRWVLGGRIEAELRVQLGPPRKSTRRIMQETLRMRKLVAEAQAIATKENVPLAAVQKRAQGMVREIAANPQPWVFAVGDFALGWMFSRIFDGIEVDDVGLQRVREAARKGPLILVPSHKSHVDYLVLSYVCLQNDLVPPYIAAGANLSFWPLGWFFRQGGAFFLRRSFKGDRLYGAVFRAYLRRILREGHNIEFFIEGGRSRNGKLLSPKLGIVSMLVEAALEDDGQKARRAHVVPISIGYEQVIEEKSYAKELAGGEKKKEDVAGLLGATRVLGSRYGKLNIQFDEPIPLGQALREAGAMAGWESDDSVVVPAEEPARRQAAQRLGHRIVYGINRVTALTPTALIGAALLAPGRRGIDRKDLLRYAAFLFDIVRQAGGRFARALVEEGADDDEGTESLSLDAIDRALDLFERQGHLQIRAAGMGAAGNTRGQRGDDEIYAIADERRPLVAIYRNNAVHFFVAESLVCLALVSTTDGLDRQEVSRRTLELSRLFKFEFTYRVGERFEVLFADTLQRLAARGLVAIAGEAVVIEDQDRTLLLAGMVRDLVESYWIVATCMHEQTEPLTEKELIDIVQRRGDKLFYVGDISRREACSKLSYQNALGSLRELGVILAGDDDKKLRAAPAALATLLESLDRYMPKQDQR